MSPSRTVGEGDRPGLFPEAVETDRLRLERLGPDTPGTQAFYRHTGPRSPTIETETEHLSWSPNATPREALRFLSRVDDAWDDSESPTYAVRPREGEPGAGEFAGTTGLGVDWDRGVGTFGIWLRKPFWGRGYSGERADAMLRLAFDRLDLAVVRVGHLPDNDNSRRAIEKYVDRHGGERLGTFRNFVSDRDGGAHDVVEYGIDRAAWAEADGDRTDVRFQS